MQPMRQEENQPPIFNRHSKTSSLTGEDITGLILSPV